MVRGDQVQVVWLWWGACASDHSWHVLLYSLRISWLTSAAAPPPGVCLDLDPPAATQHPHVTPLASPSGACAVFRAPPRVSDMVQHVIDFCLSVLYIKKKNALSFRSRHFLVQAFVDLCKIKVISCFSLHVISGSFQKCPAQLSH